jgi:hypothetical protein
VRALLGAAQQGKAALWLRRTVVAHVRAVEQEPWRGCLWGLGQTAWSGLGVGVGLHRGHAPNTPELGRVRGGSPAQPFTVGFLVLCQQVKGWDGDPGKGGVGGVCPPDMGRQAQGEATARQEQGRGEGRGKGGRFPSWEPYAAL